MSRHENRASGDDERQSQMAFEDFEVRAIHSSSEDLHEAIRRCSYPESSLTHAEAGNLMLILAGSYARILHGPDVDQRAALVAYNAIFFATAVSGYLLGERILPRYHAYLEDIIEDEEAIRQEMLDDQAAYMQDKPYMQEWITEYAGHIDPTESYPEIVAIVTAVTFKDIEDTVRQRYASVHVTPVLHEGE